MREALREETPTLRLNHLQARYRQLGTEVHEAQNGYGRTRNELSMEREIVKGSERATRPADLLRREQAQTRLISLKERELAEEENIAALKAERGAVKEEIDGVFATEAVELYRSAQQRAAAAQTAHAGLQGKVSTAAEALDSARQAVEAATRATAGALDLDTVTQSRVVLDASIHAENAAQALLDNLNQRLQELDAERQSALKEAKAARQKVCEVRAAELAEVLADDEPLEPILKAYAAARLAGSNWNIGHWLASKIDAERITPYLEALKQDLERAGAG